MTVVKTLGLWQHPAPGNPWMAAALVAAAAGGLQPAVQHRGCHPAAQAAAQAHAVAVAVVAAGAAAAQQEALQVTCLLWLGLVA